MTAPPECQAVLLPLTNAALVLVGVVPDNAAATTRVREFCDDLPNLVRSIGFRHPSAELSCVVGFGAEVWPRLFGIGAPSALHPFAAIDGAKHAPATPGDVVFHIRAERPDLCFELGAQILDALGDALVPEFEVQGFRFFDDRDLLGFVDGSENPTGPAIAKAAVIPHDAAEPEFAGGSYLVVQKYLHDVAAWNAVDVAHQERIIGRRKLTNVEIPDEELPTSAHRMLNTITDDDGNELKIVRDNMPFGSPAAGEYGTLFLGYAADPTVTERMLQHMFVGDPPGNYDRILDFSTAHTGGLFFVPSVPLLEQLADSPPT